MKKKFMAIVSSMLFVALMFSTPPATADVYIPPGPYERPSDSLDAWVSPTLFVFDMQDEMEIGWVYSDAPMYVATSTLVPPGIPTVFGTLPGQTHLPKVHKSSPVLPWGIDRTVIPFSTYVMVMGFIPGVVVSPDQVPPPVEIVITWNGVPYVVTLVRDEPVGYQYPPEVFPDYVVPYAFTYPYDPEAPWKDAYYNIWVGDPNHIEDMPYDLPFGYYFWYIFHPNVGDWIAWNCEGETKHPPTYDITALFEYSTSQIWFNHVCFDVRFLETHRTVEWAALPWPMGNEIVDELQIINLGKVNATKLDVLITIPSCNKVYLAPDWDTLTVSVRGDREFTLPLDPVSTGFKFGQVFCMPDDWMGEDLSILYPGETMTIYVEHNLVNPDPPGDALPWSGTLVFDAWVSAWEIPPWKYPRAMHSLVVGYGPFTGMEFLWWGWKLREWGVFEYIAEWPVLTPICRCPLPPQGTPEMILDPEPVDLNDDGKIDAQDMKLVRQAIVGLIPFDIRMDVNANGKVDTHDLARYKLAGQ